MISCSIIIRATDITATSPLSFPVQQSLILHVLSSLLGRGMHSCGLVAGQGGMTVVIDTCPHCHYPRCSRCRVERVQVRHQHYMQDQE
ncbi:uncharacterized protein BDZ83DRAFT_623202 [Colletotrichum acutatum]|uniref:Uncharacterized protein n=1 Tax=Glomerella acutata TaxID=27357 RepID=A0AAD8UNA6_GLOAC|nr:uncharacterized protein BDZ83DRAFT_623202 [Colletotrichum acutatum]KAK1724436.1 hypothetical protein BDZ83DRAFT_623202 [Colletotrichum acutatum]